MAPQRVLGAQVYDLLPFGCCQQKTRHLKIQRLSLVPRQYNRKPHEAARYSLWIYSIRHPTRRKQSRPRHHMPTHDHPGGYQNSRHERRCVAASYWTAFDRLELKWLEISAGAGWVFGHGSRLSSLGLAFFSVQRANGRRLKPCRVNLWVTFWIERGSSSRSVRSVVARASTRVLQTPVLALLTRSTSLALVRIDCVTPR